MISPSLELRNPALDVMAELRPIFEYWMKDRDTGELLIEEVNDTLSSVETSINGESSRQFLVALQDGNLLGIMGLQKPENDMFKHATTEDTLEVIVALVAEDARGEGIGKALLEQLSELAIDEGATELIVNSGIRYELSGWPFWQSQFGDPVATEYDYYGPGGDAKIWRKQLV